MLKPEKPITGVHAGEAAVSPSATDRTNQHHLLLLPLQLKKQKQSIYAAANTQRLRPSVTEHTIFCN